MALEKIKPRVVDATGDYTFNNVTATGNLVTLNANLGNAATANYVKTDHLLYANGVAWNFGTGTAAGGSNTQVQFQLIILLLALPLHQGSMQVLE